MSVLLFLHYLFLFSPAETPVSEDFQDIYTYRIRDNSNVKIDATNSLRVLEDTTCNLELDDVKSRINEFTSLNNIEVNHKNAYWSVIKLRNESSEGLSFTMVLGNNCLVDVYEEDLSGHIQHKKTGYLMPIPEREIKHDGDAKVRLSLNIGEEKTIWVRTKQLDHFPPYLQLTLTPYNVWDQGTDREDLFEGVFSGILMVLTTLGLIFFLYTREKFFLYYGIYAILHAIYFLSFYGYINIYFFPNNPIVTQFLWILQIPTFAMYFAFARSFVRIRDLLPNWHKTLKLLTPTLLGLFVLVTIFLVITNNLKDAIWAKNVITLVSSIIGFTFILTLLRTNRDEAKYFAAASIFLLSTLIYVSINFFISGQAYNPLFVQIGILIELIIFSMGIGHRTKLNLAETQITHDSLILQFRENEKLQRGITQKLEESVAERTHEINRQKVKVEKAREIAEQATLAKSEFLSVMSHEIRTPLNAIISLTHLMELENENPENQEYIDALKFSGESLHSLINDILDYSKIEAGKLTLESVDFSIIDLLKKINGSFKFKAQAKAIDLNLSIGEYTPDRLLGDPTRLTQIINNLLSNALKFTNQGSVNLHAYLKGVKDETATVAFKVSDTGIGIPADRLNDIFEDFEQASRETTRKYGGTGLGLAITKKLLDLHGAEIKIESTEGKGTTFKFDIDFKIDSNFQVFETGTPYGEEDSLDGARILIVDDNDMNRLVLKRLFNKWNGEYHESKSGIDACKLVNEVKFDLILMDIEMAEQDGYETARLIKKKSKLNKSTEIIAMSARGDLEAQTKATDSHMKSFIRKPFDPDLLFQQIRLSLSKKEDEGKN